MGNLKDFTKWFKRAEILRLEEKLCESENKYRMLLENLPQKIFFKDRNSVYISCNNNYARDLKITPEMIVGKTDYDFFPKELADKYRQNDQSIVAEGKIREIEEEYIRDGRRFYVHTIKNPVRNANNDIIGLFGIFWDITKQKIAENELRRNSDEFEKLNRQLKEQQAHLVQSEKMASIGQLAAGIAHEINNPVGYVSSNMATFSEYLEIIEQYISAFQMCSSAEGEERRKILLKIQEMTKKDDLTYILGDLNNLIEESKDGIRRVAEIVQNLKSFARLDEAEIKEVNINDCIEATLKIVWNELKYKCEIIKNLGDLPMIRCYPGQINQVFMNLFVNVAQAIKERGKLDITTIVEDSAIVIRVADTGIGIPAENIPKLFDPFFTTKPVGKGTGLGLSIAYGIIQKHNGTITAESEVDKGTTFTILLPLKGVSGDHA